MVGKTAHKTKADEVRLTVIKELGCLPCLLEGWPGVPTTIQHCTEAGRRISTDEISEHQFSYGGCGWHHLGDVASDFLGTPEMAEKRYGPSFYHNKRGFIARFGPERDLIKVTDSLVAVVLSERARHQILTPRQLQKLALRIYSEVKMGKPVSKAW